jgi:hypothetical protein
MCREPSLTMVNFLPLVINQGFHKSYRVLGYRGCKKKNCPRRMPRCEIPTMPDQVLKVLPQSMP